MADEQIEELPAEGEAAEGGGGGNPWVPVIAMVILLPVISFAVTEFVLIPKIVGAVNASAHGEAEKGAKEGDAEGAGAEGEGEAEEGGQYYEFDSIVANLHGSMQSRYVKVSFTAEGSDPEFATVLEANKVKIIDITIGVLNALTMKDLEQPGVKNLVKNDLLNSFHTLLKKKIIHQIYFTDFVVQ